MSQKIPNSPRNKKRDGVHINSLLHTERLIDLIWEAANEGDIDMAASRARLAITHLEYFEQYARITASMRN
jgi:hypothetical protein